ncbi:hypothetical protein [Acinetobacter sp. YH12238]|uniref:hypothetical protein n=1 Tax=Acinetobacter sp. YH12238 TaxID=2601165 RepID=UPI0015D2667F|nr:hypothetical protein [Acinetobacter sp. YH12238]
MDIEKEREAFESWFESRYDAHFMQFALDLDMYVDKHTQTCWEAWQAAKAQAVPEGFAVVPIEITPKQIEAYMKGKVFPASMGEHRKFVERLSKDYKAMIEAQEPAKAQSQAIPEGFVLVSQKELLELVIAINAVDLATHTEGKPYEVREMWQQVALKLGALCSTGASQ